MSQSISAIYCWVGGVNQDRILWSLYFTRQVRYLSPVIIARRGSRFPAACYRSCIVTGISWLSLFCLYQRSSPWTIMVGLKISFRPWWWCSWMVSWCHSSRSSCSVNLNILRSCIEGRLAIAKIVWVFFCNYRNNDQINLPSWCCKSKKAVFSLRRVFSHHTTDDT